MSGTGGELRDLGKSIAPVNGGERAVWLAHGTFDENFRAGAAREAGCRSGHEQQTDLEPDCKGLSLRTKDKTRSKGLEGARRFMIKI